MKKMIVAISVIAILVTSGLALAQGWGRGFGMGYSGYGPGASGYGPADPSDWCPRSNIAPDQAQNGFTLEQQARLNASRNGYQNYGPRYGMRGGMGYGHGAGMGNRRGPGMGYGSGYGW
ncbi:MAG: hypothetical protein OEW45_08685 [Deltaproteobacteria bacterium]|nr:hypothetical protein [Deltaproteobacteria bacterium]